MSRSSVLCPFFTSRQPLHSHRLPACFWDSCVTFAQILEMIKIEIDRVSGDYGFEAKDAAGHVVRIDTSPETGGTNFGVRPMQMLLMGLGGCSGIDIVSILKKQRQTIEGFSMKIEGEREAGKEPS